MALQEQPGVSRTMQEFTSSSTKWPGSSCAPAEFMGYSHVQVFLGGFEKKDQLAELLDVGARCIWMWFALFLNNREF